MPLKSARAAASLRILIRGASPLGLPCTLSRAPLRRRASASAVGYGETSSKRLRREGGPFAWLIRCAHSHLRAWRHAAHDAGGSVHLDPVAVAQPARDARQ